MLPQLSDEAQALRVVKLALEVDLQLGSALAGAVKPEFQAQTVGLVAGLEIPKLLQLHLLGITRSEQAIPILLAALQEEDSDLRVMAIEALGKIGTPTAVSIISQTLEDEDREVAGTAAVALGNIRSPAAEAALLRALNHPNPLVCRDAIDRLELIGSSAAVEAIVSVLRVRDGDYQTCGVAARALGTIGSEVAVPALIEALNCQDFCLEAGDYVHAEAAEALGKIGSEAVVPALIEFWHNEDPRDWDEHKMESRSKEHYDVRGTAIEALGNIGGEAATAWLLEIFNRGEMDYSLDSLVRALAKIGGEVVIEALLLALKHQDPLVSRRSRVLPRPWE